VILGTNIISTQILLHSQCHMPLRRSSGNKRSGSAVMAESILTEQGWKRDENTAVKAMLVFDDEEVDAWVGRWVWREDGEGDGGS